MYHKPPQKTQKDEPDTAGGSSQQIRVAGKSPYTLRGSIGITTGQLASGLGLADQSVRKRLSQTGSYFGIKPVRLPNGRLLWPPDSFERLIDGGANE